MCQKNVILVISVIISVHFSSLASSSESVPTTETFDDGEQLSSTVLIAITARNKAHTLPYFLSGLSALEYPKKRISLWIKSDHNQDATVKVLQAWLDVHKKDYHSVNASLDSVSRSFVDEKSSFDWSELRFDHIIQIKDEAMDVAKNMWADFVWFLDSDVLLTHPGTLKDLILQNKTVIAPMLNTLKSFSNYWCGMDDMYYYTRTDEYVPILKYENVGIHKVPLVHSAVLVNLKRERAHKLSFDPLKLPSINCPKDDIIAFALSCKFSEVPVYVSNKEQYGYMTIPLDSGNSLEDDVSQLTDIIVDSITFDRQIKILPALQKFIKTKEVDNMGFDQIYLINLARRSERKQRMLGVFQELGLSIKVFDAVDGKKLNPTFLKDENIVELPNYLDPYHDRKMKLGEIGCFLSHYKIWEEVVKNGYERIIIFEDDVRFHSSFRKNLRQALDEAEAVNASWDLLYLGRKILTKGESFISGTASLVNISYSHWTLGYALTYSGAKKLINEGPLLKLVPIDEYLPIMYNRHPRSEWASHYHNRDVKALGIFPAVVEPSHYLGQPGYITDTEDSEIALESSENSRGDGDHSQKNEL